MRLARVVALAQAMRSLPQCDASTRHPVRHSEGEGNGTAQKVRRHRVEGMEGQKFHHWHQHKNAGITMRSVLTNYNSVEDHGTRPPLRVALVRARAAREVLVTFVRDPLPRAMSRY